MKYSERIQKKIISSDKNIIQTMKLMDNAYTKLLLVFDGEKFLGIITNGDLQGAKERLARLIRDVNKCIAVLSDEK